MADTHDAMYVVPDTSSKVLRIDVGVLLTNTVKIMDKMSYLIAYIGDMYCSNTCIRALMISTQCFQGCGKDVGTVRNAAHLAGQNTMIKGYEPYHYIIIIISMHES